MDIRYKLAYYPCNDGFAVMAYYPSYAPHLVEQRDGMGGWFTLEMDCHPVTGGLVPVVRNREDALDNLLVLQDTWN